MTDVTIEEFDALKAIVQQILERDRGQILLTTIADAPDGSLPCDGTEYDITQPENARLKPLFNKISNRFGGDGVNTFKVPELRGESIRVWDNGRGVDTGRELGSQQDQSTALPKSGFFAGNDGAHGHAMSPEGGHHQPNTNYNWPHIVSIGAGPYPDGLARNQIVTSDAGNDVPDHAHRISGDGEHRHNIQGGDTETRPRNVALAAYIRY